MQDGPRKLALVPGDVVCHHELLVADGDDVLVDLGANAMPAFLLDVFDARAVDLARVGGLHRQRDGMVGVRLGICCEGKDEIGVDARLRMDGDDVEGAVSERARLVEDDGLSLGEGLEVVRPLHKNATLRGAADAAEKRQRHGDDERAGAAHDKECEPAQDPVRPSARAEKRRDDGEDQRYDDDDRRVVAGEARDEVLGARLLLRGVFDKLEDAADCRFAEGFCRADGEHAGQVHTAGEYLGALFDDARDGFAGECRGVELGRAFHNNAIDGNALARLHDDLVADFHLVRVDLNKFAILHNVRVVGRDVHHVGDGLAAFADGVALEELSHLVEQHNRGAFCHVRPRFREEHHGERADGRDGHEEVLVEDLAVADVLDGFDDDVVAGDEVGNEEERELEVDGVRLAAEPRVKRKELRCREDDEEDDERDNDAVAPFDLFFVHRW